MASFIKRIFRSPSPAKSPGAAAAQQEAVRKKSKSQGDLRFVSNSQVYSVREKDLQHKLHAAAWKGDLGKVAELCRPDKINVTDKEGRTPLLLAIASNHYEVAQHLLNEGAKMQCLDKDGRSPFVIAAIVGNPKMVQLLLSHLDNKNLVNVPDKNGLNPLIYAVKSENMPLVELLVREKYVNLDHQDKDKNTSMHYSVIQQKYELIDLLVDSGANIDAQNADGQTPLMVAAKAGDDKLTDYLLDYGVNKKLRDRAGLTALQLAEASGNRRCVELIRENRPVKANAAKDMRARQDSSAKEPATSSNGQQLSEKRFEKLFEGGAERNVDDGSDTSRILSEEKNAQSNRLDTWADSDSDDEVDSDDMVEFKKKLNNMENGEDEPKYETLFANTGQFNTERISNKVLDDDVFEVNINKEKLFPDDENWMFGASAGANRSPPTESENKNVNNTNPVVLTSFQPDFARKKSMSDENSPNWAIFIYTSNVPGAGTDASVYIQIFGTKNSSTKFYLDKKIVSGKANEDLFEQGQCDKFGKQLPDIGKPIRIKIGHDNNGAFAGWHLDKVVLQNNVTNERYNFQCNRWLAKDELDSKIEIEVAVDDNNNNTAARATRVESSVSSWNSSDDDSSYGINKKPNTTSPTKPTNILKQIEEERLMNETINSKKSKTSFEGNESTKAATKINAPPEISDVEDNSVEEAFKSVIGARKLIPPPPAQEPPKSQQTVSKLVKPIKQSTMDMDLSDNEPSQSQSQSIEGLIDQFEQAKKSTVKPQQPFSSPPQGLRDLIREEKQQINGAQNNQSPVMGLGDLIRAEKAKQNSTSSSPTKLSAQSSLDSPTKPLHLADLLRAEKEKPASTSSSQPLSPKSTPPVGLKELIREEKQNAQSRKSSVESAAYSPVSGLAELMRSEKAKSSLPSPPPVPVQSQKPPTMGLAELIRAEKANMQQQKTASAGLNTPPLGFRNDDDHQSVVHSMISSQKKTTVTSQSSQPQNMDPWGSPTTNHNDQLQLAMSKVVSFDDELEPSDAEEEGHIFGGGGGHKSNVSGSSKIGTIDQGVGTFIGSSSLTSPFNSPIKQTTTPQTRPKTGSFIDLVPEMFEESPRRMKPMTASLEESAKTNELLDKLKEKNSALEASKYELEEQLRKTELEKKKFEISFKNLDRLLAEKEQLISKMNDEKYKNDLTMRTESNDLILLRKENSDLKDDKLALENKIAMLQTTVAVAAATTANNAGGANSLRNSEEITTPLINQNQSLTIKVRELENQIEELNKDRKQLNNLKDGLLSKLDETEGDIKKQNDALQLAVLQFNVEKNALKDELTKNKKELSILSDLKKSLLSEIEGLKNQLNEKNLNYERLNMEKQNLERQMGRDRDEWERARNHNDSEMAQLREQLIRLTEKLGNAEAKLSSTEKEAKTTRNNIDERQRQIDDLREQLAKTKSELNSNLDAFRREKQEKENLLMKVKDMESAIQNNMQQIADLKLSRAINDEMRSAPISARSVHNEHDPRVDQIQSENKRLQNDVKDLNEKLHKTEIELERVKRQPPPPTATPVPSQADFEKRDIASVSSKRSAPSPTASTPALERENDKLKSEIQKLKDNFRDIQEKYSNLENSNQELNASLHSLRNQALNGDFMKREPIDITALITESPAIRQYSPSPAVDQYLLKTLLQKEENSLNATDLAEIKMGINSLKQQMNTNNSNAPMNMMSPHNHLTSRYCPKCSNNQSSAYLEMLKYEMAKRIELQVAREMSSNNNVDYTRKFINSNRFMNASINSQNYDSLYNTMSSRYSGSSNTANDLLNTLRSKYLI